MRAIVLLHEGFEEMEAVAPIDLLARADVDVWVVSMTAEKVVRGRSGIPIQAAHLFDELDTQGDYDAVVLPGGPGINALRKHPALCAFLLRHHEAGKIIGCICAAPLLLLDASILPKHYTAHPSTTAELPDAEANAIVWDGKILTSQGAGTATEFGLALVETLKNKETREQIAESICWSK